MTKNRFRHFPKLVSAICSPKKFISKPKISDWKSDKIGFAVNIIRFKRNLIYCSENVFDFNVGRTQSWKQHNRDLPEFDSPALN
jgi:hypothetical protein